MGLIYKNHNNTITYFLVHFTTRLLDFRYIKCFVKNGGKKLQKTKSCGTNPASSNNEYNSFFENLCLWGFSNFNLSKK